MRLCQYRANSFFQISEKQNNVLTLQTPFLRLWIIYRALLPKYTGCKTRRDWKLYLLAYNLETLESSNHWKNCRIISRKYLIFHKQIIEKASNLKNQNVDFKLLKKKIKRKQQARFFSCDNSSIGSNVGQSVGQSVCPLPRVLLVIILLQFQWESSSILDYTWLEQRQTLG